MAGTQQSVKRREGAATHGVSRRGAARL